MIDRPEMPPPEKRRLQLSTQEENTKGNVSACITGILIAAAAAYAALYVAGLKLGQAHSRVDDGKRWINPENTTNR